MTVATEDDVGNESVVAAAEYIARGPERTGFATCDDIRRRFGLTTPEVLEAIRIARNIERGGRW